MRGQMAQATWLKPTGTAGNGWMCAMPESQDPYIQVRNLTLRTAAGSVYEDVTFSMEKGQVAVVYGSEGTGKTSLLLTLCGRMRFLVGTATVAGYDLRKQFKKVRDLSNISLVERVNDVPENLRVRDLVAAELALCGKRGNRDSTAALLEEWHLADFAAVKYRNLPSYERILFGIMLACAGEPELLCVDDVQTGVTQHQSLKLVELLRRLAQEKGTTVLFSSTEYEIAACADGTILFDEAARRQAHAVVSEKGEAYRTPIFGTANGVELPPSASEPSGGQTHSKEELMPSNKSLGKKNAPSGKKGGAQ